VKALLLVLAGSSLLMAAGQPPVTNSHLESRAFTGNLKSQLRNVGPAWFGYEIKSMPHDDSGYCNWSENGRVVQRAPQPVHLEGTDKLAVYFRVANNQVEKIHVYGLGCEIDAGGLPLFWLTGVPAAASLTYLQTQVDGHLGNEAIFAISRHEDPAAIDDLIKDAKRDAVPHTREQALFWLAQRAGSKASATIVDAIVNDPDTQVKKHAVFALSQLPKDDGVPKLIEIARTQRNPEVRKQAFFWLGQSGDPRALSYISDVLTK
jgi:HEAT repeats